MYRYSSYLYDLSRLYKKVAISIKSGIFTYKYDFFEIFFCYSFQIFSEVCLSFTMMYLYFCLYLHYFIYLLIIIIVILFYFFIMSLFLVTVHDIIAVRSKNKKNHTVIKAWICTVLKSLKQDSVALHTIFFSSCKISLGIFF